MANPNTIDWLHYQDIQISDVDLRNRFNSYVTGADYTQALALLRNNDEQLKGKKFVANTINKIVTGILYLEKEFDTSVYVYLTDLAKKYMELIANFKKQGHWVRDVQYIPYNFVIYQDEIYMCLSTPPVGTLPTNENYWLKIGLLGEVGSPSVEVAMRYAWKENTQYVVNDVVAYHGDLYVAIAPNINIEPTSDETKWTLFLLTNRSRIVVSNNEPDILLKNTVWFKTNVDPLVHSEQPISGQFYRYNTVDGWEEMYPTTLFTQLIDRQDYLGKEKQFLLNILPLDWVANPDGKYEYTVRQGVIYNNSFIFILPVANMSEEEYILYSKLNISITGDNIVLISQTKPDIEIHCALQCQVR